MNVACTIIAKNYLAFARTLCSSYLKHNPGHKFIVLLIDPITEGDDFSSEEFEIIEAENIGIENYADLAFKYDILELSTNVKPSFMKWLLQVKKAEKVLYLDPDIYFFDSAKEVIDLLDDYSIVLTPHCLSPIEDDLRPSEVDFLKAGVFNLGFVAVNQSQESIKFLSWWEARLFKWGYNEVASGIFVDQKWINYVPCFFNHVKILKNPGYNMAYWNLHEREISKKADSWVVNGKERLVFFHFSGIEVKEGSIEVSRYQTRSSLTSRMDLCELFDCYRHILVANGYHEAQKSEYAYGKFSNGRPVALLARRMFGEHYDCFLGHDPFNAEGDFYRWAKNNGLVGKEHRTAKFTSLNYNAQDLRLRLIHMGLRIINKILGIERYLLLIQYLAYICIPSHQKEVFLPPCDFKKNKT